MNNEESYKEKELYKKAKDFFQKEFGDKAIEVHSKCVVDLAVKAAPYFDLDEDIFIVAGWMHDISRKVDADTHPKQSLVFLDKFLEENPNSNLDKNILVDCILHHGRKTLPESKYAKIMQLCDSASLRHKDWKEYKESLEK